MIHVRDPLRVRLLGTICEWTLFWICIFLRINNLHMIWFHWLCFCELFWLSMLNVWFWTFMSWCLMFWDWGTYAGFVIDWKCDLVILCCGCVVCGWHHWMYLPWFWLLYMVQNGFIGYPAHALIGCSYGPLTGWSARVGLVTGVWVLMVPTLRAGESSPFWTAQPWA